MPARYSDGVFDKFSALPNSHFLEESPKERFLYVPGTRKDRVVLVAHADTFWDAAYYTNYPASAGVGADDRAGCAIVWLLRNLGHSILILDGEEDEQRGANFLLTQTPLFTELNQTHNFMVEFDLRGASSFKCYNVATPLFREYITRATGYADQGRTSVTDICHLCGEICGANLSVGYYNEHTAQEYIDILVWGYTLNKSRAWLSQPLPKFSLDLPGAKAANG